MRQDLSLPRVVCEYEDVFPDELQGLPPHRDVDFVIELYPGTSLISMTIKWCRLSYKNSRFRYRSYWTSFIRPSTSEKGASVLFTKKEVKFKWNDPCERAFQELKRRLISAPILIVPERG